MKKTNIMILILIAIFMVPALAIAEEPLIVEDNKDVCVVEKAIQEIETFPSVDQLNEFNAIPYRGYLIHKISESKETPAGLQKMNYLVVKPDSSCAYIDTLEMSKAFINEDIILSKVKKLLSQKKE